MLQSPISNFRDIWPKYLVFLSKQYEHKHNLQKYFSKSVMIHDLSIFFKKFYDSNMIYQYFSKSSMILAWTIRKKEHIFRNIPEIQEQLEGQQ